MSCGYAPQASGSRFTWHDLTNRPDYVVTEILAALAAAAGQH